MRFSGYAIVSVSLAMQDLGDAFSYLATLGRENDRMRPVRTRTRRHQPQPERPAVANVEQVRDITLLGLPSMPERSA
jgi:hypothetical protein